MRLFILKYISDIIINKNIIMNRTRRTREKINSSENKVSKYICFYRSRIFSFESINRISIN